MGEKGEAESGSGSGAAAREWRRYRRTTLLVLLAISVGAMLVISYRLLRPVFDFNVSGDPRFRPGTFVDLAEPVPVPLDGVVPAPQDGPSIRVAIAPVISPEKSLGLYEPFVEYLGERLSRHPISLYRSSYAEVNDLVRYEKCDLAFVCTYAFVRGERDFGMELLVMPQVGGSTNYYSYIIVPKSSGAASLLDLRGKNFASADLMSNSGWLYPLVVLHESGEDPKRFFGKHVITGSHDRSVESVAKNYVDGAAVDSLVYDQMLAEDPALADRMKVIVRSPPFGIPPLVVHPGIDPVLRESLRENLLDMHQSPEGRQVLSTVNIDRFVLPDTSLYDGVRRAADIAESLE